jgi:hypothetical protein
LGFRFAPSSEGGLGEFCLGWPDFSLAFPFFFPFEDLSAAVDWTAFTSEVFPGMDVFWEAFSLEEFCFCFPEFAVDFLLDEFTEPITPSTEGFGVALVCPCLGASGR